MSTATYLSAVVYDNAAGGFTGLTDFAVPFPYLLEEHIRVYRDGVGQSNPSQWDLIDGSTVRLSTPAALGEVIVIRRRTRLDARMVAYNAGSNLGEDDLNIVTKQLLYLIQEIQDERTAADDGTGSLPDGGANDPDFIDSLADEILQRQTFQNLIDLIDLVDINAEAVLRSALENHRNWSLEAQRDAALQKLDSLVDSQGVSIVNIETKIETGELVSFEAFDAVAVRLADAEADILSNLQLIVNNDGAYASQFNNLGARIGQAEGNVSELQTAGALRESAIATLQTEVQAKVSTADLETLLTESSYVSAIEAKANTNEASIFGIESYLVGAGDFENPSADSLAYSFSIYQNTVDGFAGQLQTELEMRQALGSLFGGNPEDPVSLAAAIEQSYKTYADSESAIATSVETLQANTKPIFFDFSPPSPQDPARTAGTDWPTKGYPEGSLWYQQIDTGANRWRLKPFIYTRRNVAASYIPELDEFYVFSRPSDNAYIGMWIPAADADLSDKLGARIDTTQEALVGPDGAIADFRTRLQAVYGSAVTNVEEWLEAYVKPPEVDANGDTILDENGMPVGGIMYSGWGVRMNQYIDGQPVIAGIGLGVQADPFNPEAQSRSDFVVMADTFSVIAPPSNEDFVNGVLDPANVVVPFVIDTANQRVGIDGDLMVTGSLKAYQGGLKDIGIGRATFGQMDENLDLVDPTGFRLHALSSTDGFWFSNGPSPFPGGKNPQEFLLWAGSGTMNHNNAIFYVDTDGNAKFDGQVAADNVAGSLSNVQIVAQGSIGFSNSTDSWQQIGNTVTLNVPYLRDRTGAALVNIELFGSGVSAAEAILEMSTENGLNSNNWSSWQQVDEGRVETTIGTNLTLAGGIEGTHDGRYRIRVRARRFNSGGTLQSNSIKGYLMAIA